MLKNGINKWLLVSILIILSFISLMIGVSNFTIFEAIAGNPEAIPIFTQVRIPRLLALILAAFGLSISGLIMQHLSRNKFVSPTTATTTDGAKLGVLVAMLVFPDSIVFRISIAFIFSLISTGIFILFIQKMKIKNIIFVPLMGLMLGGIIDSITTMIAYQTNTIQNINSWLQGNLTGIIKGNYELLYIIIPLIICAFIYANKFTIAGMGEELATNLGLNYQRVLLLGLVIIALITATVVISVGVIPFLGLIIPNIVSLYRGDNIKHSLWETALLGAIFLITCDIIGRIVIFPYEIPISLTVGVIGSAIFLTLLLQQKRKA